MGGGGLQLQGAVRCCLTLILRLNIQKGTLLSKSFLAPKNHTRCLSTLTIKTIPLLLRPSLLNHHHLTLIVTPSTICQLHYRQSCLFICRSAHISRRYAFLYLLLRSPTTLSLAPLPLRCRTAGTQEAMVEVGLRVVVIWEGDMIGSDSTTCSIYLRYFSPLMNK